MWLDRLNVCLLCALLVLAPLAANASQNSLSSPATGVVSGLQLTNNYNNALDSVNTMNSGASAPTNQLTGIPSLGNRWLNTTANPYPANVYDGAQWLAPYYVDATNHGILNQVGGGTNTLASASTTSLCSVPQYFITISGSTTINALGTGCFIGQAKKITFSGTPTLTYNGVSLIIPGGANVPVTAGDVADVIYLGSGNWQVANYQPSNGAALINPAVDVGDYLFTSAVSVPSAKYLLAFGQAISRTTYANYLVAATVTQSVTATNGSPTLTGFSDTTQLAPGMAVEAAYLPNGTVIAPAGCTSTTCTLNNNATSSTTGNATVFPYGNGCGFGTSCGSPSTTFNMPDCRDVVFAGRGNMGGTARSDSFQLTPTYFGASPNALGSFGGLQSYTIQRTDLPNVQPTFSGAPSSVSVTSANSLLQGTSPFGGIAGASGAGLAVNSSGGLLATQTSTGSTTANGSVQSLNGGVSQTQMPRVQPTLTANCMVRVLAQLDVAPANQFAANDNAPIGELAVLERRRLAA